MVAEGLVTASAYLFEQANSLRIYPAGLSEAEIKEIKTAEKQVGEDIRASFRLKNKDGSINWGAVSKWGVYLSSAFVLFGCAVALSDQLKDGSGDNDNALCANLLNAAEKLNTDNHLFVSVSALDAAGAQSPDLGPLRHELQQCYSPDLSVSSGVPVFDADSGFPAQVFQLNYTGAGEVEPFLGIEVPNGDIDIDANADGRPDFSASQVSLFNLDRAHVVFNVDRYGTITGVLSGVVFDIDTKRFEPTGETVVFEMTGSGDGTQMKIAVDGGGQETRIVLDKAGIEAMFGVQKLAELTGDKRTEMAEFNQQARFEGDDPRFLVGGGESPGRLVSLPQDVLAFLRNNHEGPIINGDNFIARVSADGVCTVFTTDHLVDSGAVLSEVNDDRVVFSVNGTETVGQFRFPVPDGVACVASLAQEGSGFEPGTALVRFFRDNGKAGAQVLNEEPIRPLVNAPNQIELVKLENGFMLVTTGADGQEIEKQTVDTKDWAETIKDYFICTPEAFRDCFISVEELFDGTYLRWLEKIFPNLFDPKKVIDVPMEITYGEIIYNSATAPNFKNVDPESRPFRADVTAAMVELEVDGVKIPYRVRPSAFYNPETQGTEWVLLVDTYYYPDNPYTNEEIDEDIAMWRKNMNYSPIDIDAVAYDWGFEDPLVAKTFADFPDMKQRLADFAAGDRTALSQPGIVLQTPVYYPGTDFEDYQ